MVALDFARQRDRRRVATRLRIHRQVAHPIDVPSLIRDPLVRYSSRLRSTVAITRLIASAVLVHGLTILFFVVVGRLVGRGVVPQKRTPVKVHIQKYVRPAKPKIEPPQKRPGPIASDFAREPVARKKPRRSRAPQKAKAPTKAPPPSPEPRHIVGLSMGSTVRGSGPKFSTGTSRMGHTPTAAPNTARAVEAPGPRSLGVTGTQRVASHIPGRDAVFTEPKRISPSKPTFPPTLRAQGIEGEVRVRVKIEADGKVSEVVIAKSSGYDAFDETARKAALQEKFSPAMRDGSPITYDLSYSYRFRIED